MDYASHDNYFVEFAPTIIHEKNFSYVESNKISMLVDHEKNALGAGYIVEFIHDATENYYEEGTYACRNCNNIKFPLYTTKKDTSVTFWAERIFSVILMTLP